MIWLAKLKLTLLVSLSILVVILLWRRFRDLTMQKERPVPMHAELMALQVLYHPARLRVEVLMPREEELSPAVLDTEHRETRSWPSMVKGKGTHVVELALDEHMHGEYYFELRTRSQRTVRRFHLQQA